MLTIAPSLVSANPMAAADAEAGLPDYYDVTPKKVTVYKYITVPEYKTKTVTDTKTVTEVKVKTVTVTEVKYKTKTETVTVTKPYKYY